MAAKQDRIARIKAHLAEGYDMTNPAAKKQFDKNYKNADEKVAFFVNKEVVGELKPFMKPRFEEAQALLAQLNALKPAKAAAVPKPAALAAPKPATLAAPKPTAPAAAPKPAAPAPAAARAAAVTAARAAVPTAAPKVPKAAAPPVAAPVAAPVVAPVAAPTLNAPLRIKTPLWTRPSKVPSPKAPRASRSPSPRAIAARPPVLGDNLLPIKIQAPDGKSRKRSNSKSPKARSPQESTRRMFKPRKTLHAAPNVNINEYTEAAWANTQKKIPQLYNPFTGVQYAPTESPMDDIERAYIILRDVRSNTLRRASILRGKAKAKTRSNKKPATATRSASPRRNKSPRSKTAKLGRPRSPPFPRVYSSKLERALSSGVPRAAKYPPVAPPPVAKGRVLSPIEEGNESNSNSSF